MTDRRRFHRTHRLRSIAGALALASMAVASARAFVLIPEGSWDASEVVMHLQLGSSGGTLDDGAESWGQSAEWGLSRWNEVMSSLAFKVVRDSSASIGDGDEVNNVFWSSNVYGDSFGQGTLAVTTHWTNDGYRVEGDVIFNTAFSWNSYRGPLAPDLEDFHRVATHEFGHVLGLDHPDEYGQVVDAIMNASVSDIDVPQQDDIDGAQYLYGAASGSTTTTLPPQPGCDSCPPEYPHCGPNGHCWKLPCSTLCGADNCCGGDVPECGGDDKCYPTFECAGHSTFPVSTECGACSGQRLPYKVHALFSRAASRAAAGNYEAARKRLRKANTRLFGAWLRDRIDDRCYRAVGRSIDMALAQVG